MVANCGFERMAIGCDHSLPATIQSGWARAKRLVKVQVMPLVRRRGMMAWRSSLVLVLLVVAMKDPHSQSPFRQREELAVDPRCSD